MTIKGMPQHASNVANVAKNMLDLLSDVEYYDREYVAYFSSEVAALADADAVPGSNGWTKADYIDAINMLRAFKALMTNATPTQGDYVATAVKTKTVIEGP